MSSKRKSLSVLGGSILDFVVVGTSWGRQWQGWVSFLNWDFRFLRKPHGKVIDELKGYRSTAFCKRTTTPLSTSYIILGTRVFTAPAKRISFFTEDNYHPADHLLTTSFLSNN